MSATFWVLLITFVVNTPEIDEDILINLHKIIRNQNTLKFTILEHKKFTHENHNKLIHAKNQNRNIMINIYGAPTRMPKKA